jgi:hypothetical protein
LPSVAEVIVVCVGGCYGGGDGGAGCDEELATTEVVLLEDSFELELVTFPSTLALVTWPVPRVIIATGESALAVFSTGKRNDESNIRKVGAIIGILKFM